VQNKVLQVAREALAEPLCRDGNGRTFALALFCLAVWRPCGIFDALERKPSLRAGGGADQMLGLTLREEFQGVHAPGTMIQLRDGAGNGAAERSPDYILSITYPTADVQTALKNVGAARAKRPIVLMGDRGRGKSHILAVVHHAIASPKAVEKWARAWGDSLGAPLRDLSLVAGFHPITEAVHHQEYKFLWDLLFDRHPKGQYFRGKFEQLGQPFPPRSLLISMFEKQPTALILDEFQKWFDGLSDEPGTDGIKYRTLAENFIQNLSELSKDRPDIFMLIVSVLNNSTEAFRQIHRDTPVVVNFQGPTARKDRQNLLLHRLFENRANVADAKIRKASGHRRSSTPSRSRPSYLNCWTTRFSWRPVHRRLATSSASSRLCTRRAGKKCP
jgi:hypothetical protein